MPRAAPPQTWRCPTCAGPMIGRAGSRVEARSPSSSWGRLGPADMEHSSSPSDQPVIIDVPVSGNGQAEPRRPNADRGRWRSTSRSPRRPTCRDRQARVRSASTGPRNDPRAIASGIPPRPPTAATRARSPGGLTRLFGKPRIQLGQDLSRRLRMPPRSGAKAGMIVFAASGDNDSADGGADATNVDLPSACPHIIGCGGTRKTRDAEVVWNDDPGNPTATAQVGDFRRCSRNNLGKRMHHAGLAAWCRTLQRMPTQTRATRSSCMDPHVCWRYERGPSTVRRALCRFRPQAWLRHAYALGEPSLFQRHHSRGQRLLSRPDRARSLHWPGLPDRQQARRPPREDHAGGNGGSRNPVRRSGPDRVEWHCPHHLRERSQRRRTAARGCADRPGSSRGAQGASGAAKKAKRNRTE